MNQSKTILAHLALFAVQLLYGANYTIAKGVMPDFIAPLGLIMLRATFGAAAFWLIFGLAYRQHQRIQRQHLVRLAVCGLFGIAINQMCFFVGLNWTTPINASIIMLTVPIIVFVGGVLFLGERFHPINLLGIAIGCLGAGVLISYGRTVDLGGNGLLGDLFVLINATSYSIYLLLVRPLMRTYHPIVVMKWVFTFGWLFSMPFTLPPLLQTNWALIPPSIWWSVAYILVGVTLLAYLFNGFALSLLSSRVVGAYIYLQPVLAAIIALLAGEDALTPIKALSGGLIFLGVFLASKKPRPVVATR